MCLPYLPACLPYLPVCSPYLIANRAWPDTVDLLAIGGFIVLAVAVPVLGHWLAVIDFRRYLRALRGVMVRVVYHFPTFPGWARYETPYSIRALGLQLPCTSEEVKQAYRDLAEQLHPDRGGDRHQFMRLREHYDSALAFLRENPATAKADVSKS